MQTQEYNERIRRAGRRVRYLTALIFLAVAALAGVMAGQLELAHQQNERANALLEADRRLREINDRLQLAFAATHAIAGLVHQHRGYFNNFDSVVSELLPLYPGVSSLQLAPRGVVTYVVPLAGNEAAVGHDLLKDPVRNKEAFLARDTRQLTLAGPFNLLQGGVGAVARLPIYIADDKEGDSFWGFASALIRIPEVFGKALTALDAGGYTYTLWRLDPDSGAHLTIRASEPPPRDPVDSTMNVPNGQWHLSIAPAKGWSRGEALWLTALKITTLAGIVAAIAFTLMRQPIRLREEVAQRTRDIEEHAAHLRKLSQAVEQTPSSIMIVDIAGNIEYVNRYFMDNTGYRRSEVIGKNPRLLASGATPKETYDDLWQALRAGQVWQGEFFNRRKDGSEFTEWAIIAPVRDDEGLVTHYIAVKEDITAKRQSEADLYRLAYFDALTNLPNRTRLVAAISEAVGSADEAAGQSGFVLIDIDRFKLINDARDHASGDRLLIAVAERITEALRGGDLLARLSGDEFAVMVCDLPHGDAAAHYLTTLSDDLHACLRRPYLIDGDEVTITVSMGATLFPLRGDDSASAVLRRADTAINQAKTSGGNCTTVFDERMGARAEERFRVERELHHAVRNDELRLYLQPQTLKDGSVIGAEALIRWEHPKHGLLSPVNFIPLAEETDLIIDIGVWVLGEVCRLLALPAYAGSPSRIAVNVSPRHFRDARFVPWLKERLQSAGADPHRLTLEFTEGLLIEDIDAVIDKMVDLAKLGIHFSIDDFGTGYSSLSYLKRLPIHELKIDKIFVQDAPFNSDDASLVEIILSIAQHMQLRVVAEGVENMQQADFLNERGTVVHQGYLFGRPEPAETLLRRINIHTGR